MELVLISGGGTALLLAIELFELLRPIPDRTPPARMFAQALPSPATCRPDPAPALPQECYEEAA